LSCLLFKTQVSFTGLSVLHRKRLRYEPNRLMLPIGLRRSYNNTTITILDIIHRLAFYLKRNVSETGFCPRLQVEPTQLGLTDRASLRLRTRATAPIRLVILSN
jgi:hypothetical protein